MDDFVFDATPINKPLARNPADGEFQTHERNVEAVEINKRLFNEDTVDRVVARLGDCVGADLVLSWRRGLTGIVGRGIKSWGQRSE